MKNLFSMLAVIGLLAVAGCSLAKGKLAKIVAEANDSCPVNIGGGMAITGVELDGGMVVFTSKVDEQSYQNVCDNTADPALTKLLLKSFVAEFDKELLRELVSNEVGVKFVFKNGKGAEKEVSLSSGDLAEAKNNPAVGDEQLDVLIRIMQRKLPMDGGDGMTVTEVAKRGKALCLVVDVTNSGLTMEDVRQNTVEMSASDMFTAESISGDPLLKEAVKRGYDVLYVYKSANSAETVQIRLPNSELKMIAGNLY